MTPLRSKETRELVMPVVNGLISEGYIGRNFAHYDLCITDTERILHLFFLMGRDVRRIEDVGLSFRAKIRKKYGWENKKEMQLLKECFLDTRYFPPSIVSYVDLTRLYLVINDSETKLTRNVNQAIADINREFKFIRGKLDKRWTYFEVWNPISKYPFREST